MTNQQQYILERLWEAVKANVPPHYSPIDHFAKTLNVSKTKAYRLRNGRTEFKLEELVNLLKRYSISLDALLGSEISDRQVVQKSPSFNNYEGFVKFLEVSLKSLSSFATSNKKEITYVARDLPISHFFEYDMLGKFKIHMLVKNARGNDISPEEKKFIPEQIPREVILTGQELNKLYHNSNTTEYWTLDTLNSTIGQVIIELKAGRLEIALAMEIVENLKSIIHNINIWCNQTNKNSEATFTLYHSQYTMLPNIVIMNFDDNKHLLYYNLNGIDFQKSNSPIDYERTLKQLCSQRSDSKLISGSDEISRHEFITALENKVKSIEQVIDILPK